jgi:hypothetical protein
MAVDSADITAATLSLPDRSILIVSVYVPQGDSSALQRDATTQHLYVVHPTNL